jgi:hypothetical protein
MSMLVTSRRALRGIEKDLASSDPKLATFFSTFTLLTRDEELPGVERLKAGPVRLIARLRWRRASFPQGLHRRTAYQRPPLWPLLLLSAALTAVVCAVAVGGIGFTAARACTPPATQHTSPRGLPVCTRESSWPVGKLSAADPPLPVRESPTACLSSRLGDAWAARTLGSWPLNGLHRVQIAPITSYQAKDLPGCT